PSERDVYRPRTLGLSNRALSNKPSPFLEKLLAPGWARGAGVPKSLAALRYRAATPNAGTWWNWRRRREKPANAGATVKPQDNRIRGDPELRNAKTIPQ